MSSEEYYVETYFNTFNNEHEVWVRTARGKIAEVTTPLSIYANMRQWDKEIMDNACFIAKACNMHDKLLAVVKERSLAMRKLLVEIKQIPQTTPELIKAVEKDIHEIKQLIAEAENR